MPDAVAVCSDHGYYDADTCPECGDRGTRLLDGERRRRLSTFLSGALRHFPDDAGLTLDAAGWADWAAVVAAATAQYEWASETEVEAVVTTDPKGRFETRGGEEIRAAYGHSVDVDLDRDGDDNQVDAVPETLYHGTAPRNVESILDEGLRPMGRQAVHLSGDRETARAVGARHTDADPVVLTVDVEQVRERGVAVRKRGVATYTAPRVPPAAISRDKQE